VVDACLRQYNDGLDRSDSHIGLDTNADYARAGSSQAIQVSSMRWPI
jgi:hypothetical protein